MFLQNGLQLKNVVTLYISGEESEQQIKMRADRLKLKMKISFFLTETNTQTIFQEIKKLKPQLVIVDSIQTLQSPFVEAAPEVYPRYEKLQANCSALQKKPIHRFF